MSFFNYFGYHKSIFQTVVMAVFYFFNSGILLSQNTSNSKIIDSTALVNLFASKAAYDLKDYTQSAYYARNAYIQLKENYHDSLRNDIANTAYQYGLALKALKNDSTSKKVLHEAILIWSESKPDDSLDLARAYLNLAIIFHKLREREDALSNAERAVQIFNSTSSAVMTDRINAMIFLGDLYNAMSLPNKAIITLEQALSLSQSYHGNSSKESAKIISNLGSTYFGIGNYQIGYRKIQESLLLQLKLTNPDTPGIVINCKALGYYFNVFKNYNKALYYYSKGLGLIQYDTLSQSDGLPYFYSQIGKIYLTLKKLDSAEINFIKCSELYIKKGLENHYVYTFPCKNFASVYLAMGNLDLAHVYIEKALNLFSTPKSKNSIGIADIYAIEGKIHLANSKYEMALKSFDEVIRILTLKGGPENSALYLPYSQKALAYKNWYLNNGEISHLDSSLFFFKLSKEFLTKTLHNSNFLEEKLKVLDDARVIFENYILTDLIYQRKINGYVSNLENALQLSESLHSYVLYSTIQQSNSNYDSEIPKEELIIDSILENKITLLEKEKQGLFSKMSLGFTDSLIVQKDIEIHDLKCNLQSIRENFKLKYSRRNILSNNRSQISISDLQKTLTSTQSVVEYYIGDSTIFVFLIRKDSNKVVEIKLNFPLMEWIKGIQIALTQFHTSAIKSPSLYNNNLNDFMNLSNKLYKKLIEPISEFISSELIIIPDKELAILPFDVLLASLPKDRSNFQSFSFLIKKYIINYNYSISILDQLNETKQSTPTNDYLLAFAPFFNENPEILYAKLQDPVALRYGLNPLPYSGKEVRQISTHYSNCSRILIADSASKKNFLNLAPNYKIIHLATHARANYFAGDFSFLAFSDFVNNMDLGQLTVAEIENLKLNADLIVLSACESGTGEQQLGEGVISLARAFTQAGCKSILSTLWKVNDLSTMKIMDKFYKELALHKSKSIALRNAKLTYMIENPGNASHPFFWAGFIGIGDISALKN